MGLCKCPKRRVTNQFCFEHRVNVCEYCMVTNHPKCIVQSYLLWLQDSDYNSICELCTKELADEDCIRLICYHVYHWSCVNQYARALPSTTAPAGYMCPSCKVGIFPGENLISPVADVLRQKLAGVNWARAGLGLPLLNEDAEDSSGCEYPPPSSNTGSGLQEIIGSSNIVPQTSTSDSNSPKFEGRPAAVSSQLDSGPHSVIHVDDSLSSFNVSGFPVSGQSPHRVFEALDESRGTSVDHDLNKYNRRSAFEWYYRRWKSFTLGTSTGHQVTRARLYKRYMIATILLLIVVTMLLFVLSWLGRIVTEDDPSLDPLQNPNIHVKKRE